MKRVVLFSLLASVLISCSGDGVVITGKVKNYEGSAIYLEKKVGLIYRSIDTIFIKKDSTFKIKVKNEEPEHYRINLMYRNRVPVLVGYDDFHVEVDASNIRGKYTITGSKDHDLIEEVKAIHNEFGSLKSIKALKEQYSEGRLAADKTLMEDAEAKYQKALVEKDEMIKEIILEGLKNKAYLGVIELMYNNALRPEKHSEFFKQVGNELNQHIPNASITKRFTTYVQTIQQTVKLQQNE